MLVLPCDCCGGPPTAVACCPCDIPASDITLTWASTGMAGNGSVTLVYTPGTPPTWQQAGCLDVGVLSLGGGATVTHCWVNFYGLCSNGLTFFKCRSWYDNPGVGCGGPATNELFLTISSFTCAPFHYHHVVAGFPTGSDGFPASVLVEAGFTTLDFDSAVSTSGTCLYIFDVSGCNFAALEGVTIDVWTSAAKTTFIGTATTDAFGSATVTGTQRTTNGHYEITASRFGSASGNGLTSSPLSSNSFNLTESAGYNCTGNCAWPEPTTMHATHPVFGAITYTYSGGSWIGTKAYSYPGSVGGSSCAAKTVTITCTWDGNTGYTESWGYDGSDCPDDAGGNTATAFWTDDTLTCYVPGVASFLKTFTLAPAAGPQQNLYGTGPFMVSITE